MSAELHQRRRGNDAERQHPASAFP
jgi:hypothetical protein